MKKFELFVIGLLIANPVFAKNSQTLEKYERKDSVKNLISKCNAIDGSVLEDLKSKAVGATVTTSIGTATSTAAAVTGSITTYKTKNNAGGVKNEDPTSLKGNKIASSALNAAATVSDGIAIGLFSQSLEKFKTFKSQYEECQEAINAAYDKFYGLNGEDTLSLDVPSSRN